jgi:pentatricopeptide repeat protein
MYGECGELSLAWTIFSRSQGLDIVAWNTMIQVFIENRDLSNAMEAFAMAPDRDPATWNIMLGGLAQDGHGDMALELFRRMNLEGVVEPNVVTFVCVLNAFTSTAFLERGRLVHMLIVDLGLEKGIEIGNALISAYGRCRDAEDAKSVFERMHRRDVVSWTAIVGAWCEMGRFEEALGILKKMRLDRVPPDKVSLLCALYACASLSALEEGKEMDVTVCKLGMETHLMIRTALIDMYGKCGSVEDAMEVFDRSLERTIEMWNAVLTTLSQRGFLDEVRVSLMQMQQQNIMPNHVTLSCVLAACSHSGSVEDASRAFLAIDMLHGFRHTEDHYLCIVDLFARTGELEKAQEMIENFPFQSDECLAWQCLLSGCRIHNDVERAVHVAMHCVCIDTSEVSMKAYH